MISEWQKSKNLSYIIIIGLLLRSLAIAILEFYEGDASHRFTVTDIDYKVYTDAGQHTENPYLRHTYRYSPILAYLMILNQSFGQWIGKMIFVGFDLVAMLGLAKLSRPQYRRNIVRIYAYNPLFIYLTVRGSCESITLALMFWTFHGVFGVDGNAILEGHMNKDAKISGGLRRNPVLGYILYGLWVHIRLYPIIFLPLLLIYEYKICRRTSSPFVLQLGKVSALSGGVFLGLFGLFYHCYGWDFVQETYLYHLSRLDHRHSFSPIFYEIYLGMNTRSAVRSIAQVAIIVSVTKQSHSRLSPYFAIFLMTYAFVNFNTVITLQYYMWVWGALILVLPESSLMTNSLRRVQKSVFYTLQWVLGIMIWVWLSTRLETKGENVFKGLWVICITKLFMDIWVVSGFIKTIKNVHGYNLLPVRDN